MENIKTLENLTNEEIEAVFRERASVAISGMEIKPFDGFGLELARSDKEIAKCKLLAEKAAHKAELRKRDREEEQNPENIERMEKRNKLKHSGGSKRGHGSKQFSNNKRPSRNGHSKKPSTKFHTKKTRAPRR